MWRLQTSAAGFDFMTNSKLQNFQGQFGGSFRKGLNSDKIKKK